mgnify:CR=1 FL=1
MVVLGRCCWGAGAAAGTVGRVGARAGARPADRLRGMVMMVLWCVVVSVMTGRREMNGLF